MRDTRRVRASAEFTTACGGPELCVSVADRYRSSGRCAAAVRGTVDSTSDRGDGTLTAVKRGVVAVVGFRGRRRRIVLRVGRSYLIRAS